MEVDRLERIESAIDLLSQQVKLLVQRTESLPRSDKWLSIQQAVMHAKMCERSIRGLIAKGTIETRRPVGGRTVINRHELDAYIESCKRKPRKGRGHHLAALKIAANGDGA